MQIEGEETRRRGLCFFFFSQYFIFFPNITSRKMYK